jgi:hypothetical protein
MNIILIITSLIILYFISKVLAIYFKQTKLRKKSKIYEFKYDAFVDHGLLEVIFKYNAFLNNWDIIKISKVGKSEDIWNELSETEKILINVRINSFVNDL